MRSDANVDPREVARFGDLAARWWDPDGELRTLHDLNPARVGYIAARCELPGTRVLDIGCGGGLLSEALAERGAVVTGIDASERAVEVAKLHLLESGLTVAYECETAEAHAAKHPGAYDLVTCLELLEHVPEPASVVAACAALVRPGGAICFSTLNRTPAAWALGVVAAEYILELLPRGTHDWSRFIRPSELDAHARAAGLRIADVSGLRYDPFSRTAEVAGGVSINYLAWFER
ncbi:MAG: bifunctional 2-polyprenyl-6-hydroxyphenol methylase/3-demethylubiquinol 3-O-methyltransferase UbiG [Gammaproteobacteria bacterium]